MNEVVVARPGKGGVPEYDFHMQGTADWQGRDAELAGALGGRLVAGTVSRVPASMTEEETSCQR